MPVARGVAAHPTTRRLSAEFWAILGATGTMLTVTVTLAAFILSNQNNAAEDRRSMREEIQSIRGEIHALRSDIQSEIRSLRTEFQTEIRALRSEVRDEISSLRAVPDSAKE